MTPAWAQRIGFKEGTDYSGCPQPVPVAAPAGQIEVVEFFAYSCIHCFRFEPSARSLDARSCPPM